MDQFQEAKQGMIETVIEFLEERPDLLRDNLALAEEYEHLTGTRDQLEDLSGTQATALTGITSQKAAVREELAKAVVICNSQLYSHGVRSKNEDLRHQFRGTPTDITRLPDLDLRKAARRTLDAIQKYESDLATCGYTAELGESLTTHYNLFRKLLRAPRKAVSNRASVTVGVAKTIDDAIDRLRDQLDPLMQQYWGIDRPLYDAYRKARRLTGIPRERLTDEQKAQAKERAKQRLADRKAKAKAKTDAKTNNDSSPTQTRSAQPTLNQNGNGSGHGSESPTETAAAPETANPSQLAS